MKEKIKAFLRTNILTRHIYKKWALHHYKKVIKRKRKMMAKNGVNTLHYLQDLLQNGEYEFFFDMGTLLGIIRDGRLLKHDIDVDIAVYVESEEQKVAVRDMIVSHGNSILYSYSVDSLGVVEESYIHDGIKFDISYYSRNDDIDVCYLMYSDPDKVYESTDVLSVVRLECKKITDIEKLDFYGKAINVPKDSKGYLAQRYGESWTVPDPDYVYWKGPSAHITDKIGRRKTY